MPANYRRHFANDPLDTCLLIIAIVLIYAAVLIIGLRECDAVPYWTGPETQTTNNEQRELMRVAATDVSL